jgi:hypothetical protein
MSRAPPSSLMSSQFEQESSFTISPPSQPFQQQPQQQSPVSMLQRAIQQSNQQFNPTQTTLPMSNGFNNAAPFQPFDLISSNTYPGFPIEPLFNQVPFQQQQQQQPQQQQSPVQPNNIRLGSPQTMSSPPASHSSPPSQTQPTQQMSSPRMSGGSTLQFVPSQVLRKMSKTHK